MKNLDLIRESFDFYKKNEYATKILAGVEIDKL